MRPFTLVIFVLFLASAGIVVWMPAQPRHAPGRRPPHGTVLRAPESGQELSGETILYDVKLGSVNIGTARFRQWPPAELEGRKVSLATFETSVVRFKDKETIYSDPLTKLPIRVERSIVSWPMKEEISEVYDQSRAFLHIIKRKGKQTKELFFKKDGPIHNAILLPYYVRQVSDIRPGWSLRANLPTQEFIITLEGIDQLIVPAGQFKAYHFKSTPERFEIWISADERRIPLKIKGSSGIGYMMLMRNYSVEPAVEQQEASEQ